MGQDRGPQEGNNVERSPSCNLRLRNSGLHSFCLWNLVKISHLHHISFQISYISSAHSYFVTMVILASTGLNILAPSTLQHHCQLYLIQFSVQRSFSSLADQVTSIDFQQSCFLFQCGRSDSQAVFCLFRSKFHEGRDNTVFSGTIFPSNSATFPVISQQIFSE